MTDEERDRRAPCAINQAAGELVDVGWWGNRQKDRKEKEDAKEKMILAALLPDSISSSRMLSVSYHLLTFQQRDTF